MIDGLPEGYRGQKYQVDFRSPLDGHWYPWGWQNAPAGGIASIVENAGLQVRVIEVSSVVRAIYKAARKEN